MARLWIERISLLLVIIGALNWGLVGLFKFDLVAEIVGKEFGETNSVSRVIYTLVGLAALVLLGTRAAAMNADTDVRR
jgi:uncharacterized membrane protein YuzA (DUF378 family)